MQEVLFLGCRVDPALETIPDTFVDCAVTTQQILDKWLTHQYDEDAALRALRDTVVEHHGQLWAYGVQSKRWFVRNDDGSWVVSHPTLAAVE